MLFTDVLVTHLFGPRTHCYYSFFVIEERMGHPRKFCQQQLKLLLPFRAVKIRRREDIPCFFSHRVSLLVDVLLSDGQHFLKISMNGGLQHFVAFERSQLAEIKNNERRGRQEHRHTQRQHQPEACKTSEELSCLHSCSTSEGAFRMPGEAYTRLYQTVSRAGKKKSRFVN